MTALTTTDDLAARTWAALVHHPVHDRTGGVVSTAVTNLDIHDIARAARTYGLAGYLIVTPIERQREMVVRILAHWKAGAGKSEHPDRADALERVDVVPSIEAARAEVASRSGGVAPEVTATTARLKDIPADKSTGYTAWPGLCDPARPQLLLFGTGWGLTAQVLGESDRILLPIRGKSDYNHLSVRSAVSVIFDRLFGDRAADA